MRLLKSYEEFRECLGREPAIVLFEWVDWSRYSRELGLSVCEEAESRWFEQIPERPVVWCYGDFSNIASPMTPVYNWLLSAEPSHGFRTANVGTGNGALFWIGNGMLLDLSMSAYQLGVEAVLQKAARSFAP